MKETRIIKRGRPRLKDDRKHIINARFNDAELILISGYMKRNGIDAKSTLMRNALLSYISQGKELKKPPFPSIKKPSELSKRVKRIDMDKRKAIAKLSKIHGETERLILSLKMKEDQEIDFKGQEFIAIPEHTNEKGQRVMGYVKEADKLTDFEKDLLTKDKT